jgi:hypothetical protein
MDKAELLEELRKLDEVTLIELLGVNSTSIVDAFLDIIDDNIEYLHQAISEEQ